MSVMFVAMLEMFFRRVLTEYSFTSITVLDIFWCLGCFRLPPLSRFTINYQLSTPPAPRFDNAFQLPYTYDH